MDDFTKDFNLIYQNTCQVYGDKSLTIQMFDMLYEIMNKVVYTSRFPRGPRYA